MAYWLREIVMTRAEELFENTIAWLKHEYNGFQFFVERDVVWTLQRHILSVIREQALPCIVFNDYPILPSKRRSICTDLAILSRNGVVEVAVEFKYEPAHARSDIWPSKFPVVFWGHEGVGGDIERIQRFVNESKAKVAYSLFVDEGGYFRHREAPPGAEWIDWEVSVVPPHHVSILWAKVR